MVWQPVMFALANMTGVHVESGRAPIAARVVLPDAPSIDIALAAKRIDNTRRESISLFVSVQAPGRNVFLSRGLALR